MSEKNGSTVVEVTAAIGEGEEEVVGLMKSSIGADNKKSSKIISTTDTIGGTWRDKYLEWKQQKYRLPRHYRLHTEQDAAKYSLWSINFIITTSAINTKMLNPNFAIMCNPNSGYEDSFESTEPFGFNSATYFLPMCTLIGVAIASVFIGQLSDKFGRKKLLLILGWISTVGSIIKYYTKDTFWGFCASNFAFGFFLGNLPVGMAYIGDVEHNQKRKNEMLGVLVGCFVGGNSGGGIIAVLMNDFGLFAPLWIGAILMAISCVTSHIYMIEPGDGRLDEDVADKLVVDDDDDEEEIVVRPETIAKPVMYNIVGGALLDNIGSTGLFPLCLSPLALQTFYGDFVAKGEEPIMTITAYQWLSVCVALLVIPSTQVTPWTFSKVGVAGTCVFGNLCTAVVTGLLLMIANFPATSLTFGFFVFVMYAGFPFTVLSQLTTGPMLDVIAPEDKIGYVQGLNNSSMNFGMALAPWAFGLLADAAGTNIAIICGIAFSVLAALANSPLMWNPQMGKQKPKPPLGKRKLPGEDDALFQKILDGDVVDPEMAFEINRDRGLHGKPAITPRIKTYEEEKDHLDLLAKGAGETFKFRLDLYDRVISGLSETGNDPKHLVFSKDELIDVLNSMKGANREVEDEASRELGQWFGEYLADNGYTPHTASVLMKQLFISSFPPLTRDRDFTEDNVMDYLLRSRKVLATHVEQENKNNTTNTLALHPYSSGWW